MRNALLLVAFSALRGILFCIPVITIFWKDQIGMSLTDIMLLQSIFSAAIVLFEFPTGYIADRIGYRKALILSSLFLLLGWTAYSLGRSFLEIAVAEVLLAVGIAFHSGSDSALLYVSLAAEQQQSGYSHAEGRLRAAMTFAEALSSVGGGLLYAISPRLPFWLQLPAAGLCLLTALALRDVATATPKPLSHARHALRVIRTALWDNPRLASAIALGTVLSLASFIPVWLIQPYMQKTRIPIDWFGPIWAAANLCVACFSLASHRIHAALGTTRTLALCVALLAAGYALLSTLTVWYGFAFYFLITAFRGIQIPLLTSEIQKDAPEGDRAGVLSLKSLLFRLSFIATGPLVGAAIDRYDMSRPLLVAGGALTLLSLVCLLAFARSRIAIRPPGADSTP